MYKEGNPIVFKSAKGQHRGFLLKVDAFPLIDFVVVKDGLAITVYELATGLEVMGSQSFSIDDFVRTMLAALEKKCFSDISFFKKLQSDALALKWGANGLKIINESPSYEKWLQKEKERVDNLPLLYTPEEIEQINLLISKAIDYGLFDFVKILEGHKARKTTKYAFLKSEIAFLQTQLENLRLEKFYNDLKAAGQPLPKGVTELRTPYELTWQGMLDYINYDRKRPLTKYIPLAVLQKFFTAYLSLSRINNSYGYYRVSLETADIQIIALDNKKGRNIADSVEKFDAYLSNLIREMSKIAIIDGEFVEVK